MTLIHHRGAMKLIHRKYVMDHLLVLRSELVAVLRPPKKSRSMSRLKGSPCFLVNCDPVHSFENKTKMQQSKNLASDQCLRSGMTTIKPIESETGRTGTGKVAVPRPLELQINME